MTEDGIHNFGLATPQATWPALVPVVKNFLVQEQTISDLKAYLTTPPNYPTILKDDELFYD